MSRILLVILLGFSLAFLPAARASAPEVDLGEWAATAEYCAPIATDLPAKSITGVATWFDAQRHGMTSAYVRAGIVYYIAAGPALRDFVGWKHWDDHFTVLVTSELTGVQIVAEVVDWCSCSGYRGVDDDRIADLSPALFTALGARLSRGIQVITIEKVLP